MRSKAFPNGGMREGLIREAREQLERNPRGAISMRGIARELGVSSGAPYRHFKAATELEEALCTLGWKELKELDRACRGDLACLRSWVRENKMLFHLMLSPLYAASQWRPEHPETLQGFEERVWHCIEYFWDVLCSRGEVRAQAEARYGS